MIPSVGVVLVHGYTKSAANLANLAARLEESHPSLFTTTVGLHECAETAACAVPRPPAPRFDGERFVEIVRSACDTHREAGREVVLIGHSTGGSICLEVLAELLEQNFGWTPLLVVLASVPASFDSIYALRWHRHLGGRGTPGTPFFPPTLADMGRLVRLVTSAAQRRFPQKFPVLVLNGESDDLVPAEVSQRWLEGRFALPARHAIVLGAGHDPFDSGSLSLSAPLIERDMADAAAWLSHSHGDALFALGKMDPALGPFFLRQPLAARHVVQSPAGWRALHRNADRLLLPPNLSEIAGTDPVLLNVEVTSRCPMACLQCARTLEGENTRPERDLFAARLNALLGIVPSAARVTLGGLGEPLCHPEIARLVALSSEAARRTTLVTNAMLLTPKLGAALLEAGVDGVTFRLDALTPRAAIEAPPEASVDLVMQNIRRFVELARQGVPGRVKKPPTLTVWIALDVQRAAEFGSIVDFALSLRLDALMVSDLNFVSERAESLAMAARADTKQRIRSAIAKGLKQGLPIVGPRILEEIGPVSRSKDASLLSPESLWTRPSRHAHCLSPWQCLAVSVDGDVSACDCTREAVVGNVFAQPLPEVWNGPKMRQKRAQMLSEDPPKACLVCPRF